MPKKRVLFISGSVGLGHAIRDLAIARELRKGNPDMEISWLAGPPAGTWLQEAGESMHPEIGSFADDTGIAEKTAGQAFRLNLLKYLTSARGEWRQNAKIFEQVATKEPFDLIVADEAYEVALALRKDRDRIKAPFVMIFDCIGSDSMTGNPLEKFLTYMWNRKWATAPSFYSDRRNTALFVGELADVPEKSLGPFLPKRRLMAEGTWQFIGYIVDFDPSQYADTAATKARLGYDDRPLVICSIGGTAVGKDLLTLCARACPIVRKKIPDLRMVLVCGPRVSPDSLNIPPDIEVRGYVPRLYEHFAASDLAIVQAGGNTTIELTALRRPFLYFPLEEHFEQQIHVSGRLARHQSGVKMQYSQTTPDSLAERIVTTIGKQVTYPPIPIDGARRAVEIINQLL